jgi:hypothetical protein
MAGSQCPTQEASNNFIASSSTYNILKEAVTQNHNWSHLAEVERYRRLNEELGELNHQLHILQDKQGWVEEHISTCQHCMEGAQIPTQVGHLKQHYPLSQIGKHTKRFANKP